MSRGLKTPPQWRVRAATLEELLKYLREHHDGLYQDLRMIQALVDVLEAGEGASPIIIAQPSGTRVRIACDDSEIANNNLIIFPVRVP